jgi:hypothetical protein
VTFEVVVRGELAYAGRGGGGPFIIAPTIILFEDGGGDGNRSRSDRCSTGDRLGVGARAPMPPSPPLPEPKPVPPVIMLGPVKIGVFVPYRDPALPPPNVDGLGGGRVRCIGGDKLVSPLGRDGARDDEDADAGNGGGPCELWE